MDKQNIKQLIAEMEKHRGTYLSNEAIMDALPEIQDIRRPSPQQPLKVYRKNKLPIDLYDYMDKATGLHLDKQWKNLPIETDLDWHGLGLLETLKELLLTGATLLPVIQQQQAA